MAKRRRTKIQADELVRRIKEARASGGTELDSSDLGLIELAAAVTELSQLRSLDLSGNHLTELPEAMGELSSLETLDLRENQLSRFPEVIGQLSQLQVLDLGFNNLTELPAAIGQLSELRYLSLGKGLLRPGKGLRQLLRRYLSGRGGNQLTTLPAAIGQLSRLQTLDLSENRLTVLPAAIGRLSRLRSLDLGQNRLIELPEMIGQLSQLQTLDLRHNQLTELPAAIGQLSRLQTLDLKYNQLTDLPTVVHNLTSLEELYLHGNFGLELPPEVLGPTLEEKFGSPAQQPANPRDVLDYYFRTRGGRRPLNEAKLILVGYGNVGKISLVNQLVHGEFNKSEKKTEGINITQWPVSLLNGERVRLHIWDFGEQEIMHSTHQFFLTQRSLYLLVLNGRQGHEDADADYWLSLIDSFGEGSPVLVVLNKIREHPFDLNGRGLMQKFGIVRDFLETTAWTRQASRN